MQAGSIVTNIEYHAMDDGPAVEGE